MQVCWQISYGIRTSLPLPVLSIQKPHPKTKAKTPDHLQKQTTFTHGAHSRNLDSMDIAEELRAALNQHPPGEVISG